MKRILLLSMVLLGALASGAHAQRTVSGKVTSQSDGEPLIGVNVRVEGTTTGAITDIEGKYSVSVPGDDAVLVFSFVGYTNQNITVGARSVIDVQMAEDAQQLQEIVVTGYGTQQKRDVSGAITSVRGDVIENVPLQSFDRALQGRAAGVQISAASGQPGGALNINVRGVGSLQGGGNEPLWIVDGVQMNSGGLSGQGSDNALGSINPNDIESIDVLKDAAASAIYGAQAANGVVIITTKKGRAGKTRFNFSIQEGVTQPMNLYDVMSASEFLGIRYEAYRNDGLSDAQFQNDFGYAPNEIEDATNYSWRDATFRNARLSTYDLSASGGDEKTRFFISGAYTTQDGQVIRSDWNRMSLRANLSHKATDKLTISTQTNLALQQVRGSIANGNFVNGPFVSGFVSQPHLPIQNEDGTWAPYPSNHLFGYNIIEGVNEEERRGSIAQVIANLNATYQIAPWLSATVFGGLDFADNKDVNNRPSTIPVFRPFGGQVFESNERELNWNANAVLNFNRTFGDVHKVTGTVGAEYKTRYNEFASATVRGFADPALRALSSGANLQAITGFWTEYKRAGVFGKAAYTYDDRYTADLTLRRDGNSRFGSNNQWGNFWATSVSWRLTSESFMEGVNGVEDLKLRVSYGTVGNSEGINDFASRAQYSSFRQYRGFSGLSYTRLENDLLGWEEETMLNIGVDFSLFKNRIAGSVEAWNSNTGNQLLTVTLPLDGGFRNVTSNAGNVYNEGIDIELNGTIVRAGDFSWNSQFNISFLRNEVTELVGSDTLPTGVGTVIVGQPIGIIQTYDFVGVNPANGKAMFRNADGVPVYGPTQDDLIIAGTNLPKQFGGWNHNFSYKGLNLDVFFQYQLGNTVFNGDLFNMATSGTTNDNQLTSQLDYWRTEGDLTNTPRPVNNGFIDNYNQFIGSTRYVSDGGYIRLKQVRLAYDFPSDLIGRVKLNNLSVFGQAINSFTWTNFEGIDPEVINENNSSFGTYPNGRQYTFGLQVGF